MKDKIKHYIVCFRQFLYEHNEVVKDSITAVFGLVGIAIGLLVYVPIFILYAFLMYSSDFLYVLLNGSRKESK